MEQDLLENPKFVLFMGWIKSLDFSQTTFLIPDLNFKSKLLSCSLKFIHFVFWIASSLSCQAYFLKQKATHFYIKYILNIFTLLQGKNFECKEVIYRKANFKKVPKHIVLVLNQVSINYKVLSDIAIWSFLTGIENITVISSSVDYKVLEKLYKISLKKIKLSKNLEVELLKKFENINLSTIEKEQKIFIEKVKQMTENKSTNFTLSSIDTFLKKDKVQDPEVMISFGPYYSMYGYAPWNTRLTEFFDFRSHHNFTYLDFISVLESYSKCHQRVGK